MSLSPQEAFFRLQSGAEDDVEVALTYFRRAGATRFVQEAEATLAATA